MKLCLYGADGFGKEVYDIALRINNKDSRMDEIFFIDDTPNIDKTYNNSRLFSVDNMLEEFDENAIEIIIALGLPVINNYPGWLAEMITDNNCGLAVTPRNAEAFSEALITMKSDRESLFRMGQNAKQLAASKFDRNRLSDQFVDFLVTNING